MNKASPVDLRKSMMAAEALMQVGIMFVPMPVANPEEAEVVAWQAEQRLQQMFEQAERDEGLPSSDPCAT